VIPAMTPAPNTAGARAGPAASFRAEEFASSASCPAGPLRSATAGDGGRGRAGRRIGEIKALLPALLRPRCRGGASLQWQPDGI